MEYNLKYEEYCIQNENKEILSFQQWKHLNNLLELGYSKESALKLIKQRISKGFYE